MLSTAPAATAANGLPPASTTPTAANCEPPAKTSSDIATGTHQGRPPATAVAPNDRPTSPSARQTSATSRASVDPRGDIDDDAGADARSTRLFATKDSCSI